MFQMAKSSCKNFIGEKLTLFDTSLHSSLQTASAQACDTVDPSRQNGQLEPASDRFVKAQSILGILTLQTYAFPFSNAKDILPGSHLRLVSDAQLVPGHYTIEFTNFLRLRFRLGSLG